MGQPIHKNLVGLADYPHTMSFCIRKAMQINSFMELPEDKRPPRDIWDDELELEIWMKNLSDGKENKAEFIIRDDEIEG